MWTTVKRDKSLPCFQVEKYELSYELEPGREPRIESMAKHESIETYDPIVGDQARTTSPFQEGQHSS